MSSSPLSSQLFDQPPQRMNTGSVKWNRYAGRDVIPMWIADMDFAAPQPILDAIHQRVEHGVMGYTDPWPSLLETIVNAMARDFDWQIQPEWLVFVPGVVPSFNLACQIAGEPGDSIFTLTPAYPPMFRAPGHSNQRLVQCDMLQENDHWTFDWDGIAATIEPSTSMMMLCNPHNPIGRVYRREELQQLAEIALRRDLLICSDEIHAGLVHNPARKHIPIATLDESIAQRTITLMAPSKTWNIAGLSSSFAIIPNAALRKKFRHAMEDIISDVNVLGLVATEAAYRDGEPWRAALLNYLRDNAALIKHTIDDIPGLHTTLTDATYLAWIDCRELGVANPAAFFEEQGIGLSDGKDFGAEGFVRLNFGCSRQLLTQALERIKTAVAVSTQSK